MSGIDPPATTTVDTAPESSNITPVMNALNISTMDPLPGWPTCEKVVYENRQPGPYVEIVHHHSRESCTVLLIMRGRLLWRRGGRGGWTSVATGQALVYDAGLHGDLEYHGDADGGHLEFIYANLVGPVMRSAVLGIVERCGHTALVHGGDELVKRWSAKLIPSSRAPAHRCLSVVESSELAWSFLCPLARGLASTNHLAERAMTMLTAQWQDPPHLSEVAKRLQVSREHLSRVLRTTCGQPPGMWLRRYRLSRAADLLESGYSIQEVTKACGYCSVPHFIHAFRQVQGTTPGRWLRSKQA